MSVVEAGIQAQFRHQWPGFLLDVAVTLPRRGVTALFGHSGSGKSSFLRFVAGLERPHAGRLDVLGECWEDVGRGHFLPTHRRSLGMVFQEASLFPHLTVRRNLEYGLKRVGLQARGAAWDDMVGLMGIGPLLERRPDGLSGGERQRVGIARAVLLQPRLLLMDEPLSALDMARKAEILPYLERLRDELAMPVIYVSHAPDEVARLADHIVILEAGRVVATGPLAETLARVDLPIRLGEDTGVVLEGTVSERDENWHLMRVAFPGGLLWTRDVGRAAGSRVRMRVLARDVSVMLGEPVLATSILNTLKGKIEALADDAHPGIALARVRIGGPEGSAVVARLTRRSVAGLELRVGKTVWVQIKAAALLQ